MKKLLSVIPAMLIMATSVQAACTPQVKVIYSTNGKTIVQSYDIKDFESYYKSLDEYVNNYINDILKQYEPAKPTQATTEAVTKQITTEATTQATTKQITTEATTQATTKAVTTEATTETTTAALTTQPTTQRPTTTQSATQPTTTKPTTEKTTEKTTEAATQTTTQRPTTTQTTTQRQNTTQTAANSSSMDRQILDLVNKERAAYGLAPLTLNSSVSRVAQAKAQDMYQNGYFSHTSPTYGSPFDMMKSFGISYRTAGENIAKGQKTAEAVMNAWMNSEGHRKNILGSGYTQLGVGYVNAGGSTYWVQMFIG